MRILLCTAVLCISINVYADFCSSLFRPISNHQDIKQTRAELTALEKVEAINQDRYDQAFDGKIRADYIPEFDTIRQYSVSGRIPSDAKVRVLVTHGSGAIYSHSDAMRQVIRWLGEDKGLAKLSSNISKIREYPNFTKVAIEAIDLPFHGKGSRAENLRDKDEVSKYLERYLIHMKEETPHLPIVVFGRSSSPSLFIEILTRNPSLIDAVIFMSPVVPLNREIVMEGTRKALEMAEKGEFAVYPEGLAWIDNILLNTRWNENSLNHKPALFLTGREDWEVVDIERNFMSTLAQKHSNVRHIDIPGAGHDVFRQTKINTDKQVLETLKAIEDFLAEVAKTKN